MVLNKQLIGGVTIAVVLAIFAFTNSVSAGSLFANTASAGYGQEKVKICHKGKTISVAASAVKDHLKHGDVVGACSI